MRIASFRRIALTWMVVQCFALALRLLVHPQGHFSAVSPSLVVLGFGFSAISGLGIAVVYWAILHAIAFLSSRVFGRNHEHWGIASQAAIGVLTGIFAICWLNQVFQDDDLLLFALFVALGFVGFLKSVSLDFPEK